MRLADGRSAWIKGPYLIVDGGYHRWRVLQCTAKNVANPDLAAWVRRMESVRKDVECTFGIMKKRHRILKSHLLLQDQGAVDAIFKTSCILHNMLLRFDGYEDRYKDPVFWVTAPGVVVDPGVFFTDAAEDSGSYSESEDQLKPDDEHGCDIVIGRRPNVFAGIELDTTVELEEQHTELRDALVANFKYQKSQDNIFWLR